MRTFRFFDFPVYQDAKSLHKQVLTAFSSCANYSLRDQANRASLSVMLNIAEGSAKKSDREFAYYLERSIASANETAACLDLINSHATQRLMDDYESVVKQLGGLIKKLHAK